MKIILCKDYEELSKKAAKIVSSQIILKPDCTLGLATGSTPLGLYNELAKMYRSGEISFEEVKTFNLDEYYPIKKSNSQSYDYFMRDNLFSKINIKNENIHIPNGECEDTEKECLEYEQAIKKNGGIDLQVLGIGRNGHIGFNEPGASLESETHLTELTKDTIDANSRFFDSTEEVPKQALTMGMSTILHAKKIILLASGANKRRVVSELINDGINTNVPATLLKTHPDVTLICDEDAYSGARLGIDIGGTNTKMVVIDKGEMIFRTSIPAENTEEKIIEQLIDKINFLKGAFNIATVGIGTPGLIKDGRITAFNLPFKDTPLEEIITKRTNLYTVVDNDANCAALGEIMFGSTKDCENILLITLGTGVGGGIIMNRKILHSNNNMGEIGHFVINADSNRKCSCGQNGCFEQYCSMTALANSAKEAAVSNPESLLAKMVKRENFSGRDVFMAVEDGCPIAKKVFDEYIHYLACGINSLMYIFGSDAIVLAGGATEQGNKLLKPLKKLLRNDIRLEISTLQNNAGSLGAAMLC